VPICTLSEVLSRISLTSVVFFLTERSFVSEWYK